MLFAGLIIGFILGVAAFFYVMKNYMISKHKIRASFEQVQKAIVEVIPNERGWAFPFKEWGLYKALAAKNFNFSNIKSLVIYFTCNASIANRVLQADPGISGIMPCGWALYETTQGEVFIAKMNIPLMSKMYFGVIGRAMREVAKSEKVMLRKIRERCNNEWKD